MDSTVFTKRGGRPRAENPRVVRVSAALTEIEAQHVFAKIQASGLTKSEAIRLLLLGEPLPEMRRVGFDPAALSGYAHLAPLASNLNQIARWFNKARPEQMTMDQARTAHKNIERTYAIVQKFRQELLHAGGAAA